MGKWDNYVENGTADTFHEPMHTVIQPLDDEADDPTNKLAALMFVIWSGFMMALGFMIAMVVQGHIVFR